VPVSSCLDNRWDELRLDVNDFELTSRGRGTCDCFLPIGCFPCFIAIFRLLVEAMKHCL
jgi:hypothetical protein